MPADFELFRAIHALPEGKGDATTVAVALEITEPMALPRLERAMLAGHVSDDGGIFALTDEGKAVVPAADDSADASQGP